jgi:NADH-quinone oxidoreductase subunit A
MWPLLAYFALVILLVTCTLAMPYLLGPRHSEPATGEPYEGGIVSEGSARVCLSVRYCMIAAFLAVFDLEGVFLLAWAVAVRELGWSG